MHSRRFLFACITFGAQLPTLGIATSSALKTHDPFIIGSTILGGLVSLGANAALTYFGFQGGQKVTFSK